VLSLYCGFNWVASLSGRYCPSHPHLYTLSAARFEGAHTLLELPSKAAYDVCKLGGGGGIVPQAWQTSTGPEGEFIELQDLSVGEHWFACAEHCREGMKVCFWAVLFRIIVKLRRQIRGNDRQRAVLWRCRRFAMRCPGDAGLYGNARVAGDPFAAFVGRFPWPFCPGYPWNRQKPRTGKPAKHDRSRGARPRCRWPGDY